MGRFFIKLKNGGEFDPKAMTLTQIELDDIAHALSHICRYAGHCRKLYSVAEHSVLVSKIIRSMWPDDVMARWAGLLHDATEAYVCDLPTPLKVLLPDFIKIEDEVATRIAATFTIDWTPEVIARVKQADAIALSTEARMLFDSVEDWDSIKQISPMPGLLNLDFPLNSPDAKELFLNEFKTIKEELRRV